MNKDDLISVPGYPNYKINSAHPYCQIISYAVSQHGRSLAMSRNSEGDAGYRLCRNSAYKFFSVSELKAIVASAKGEIVNRTSVSGVVKTGDFIVGSVEKTSGRFSTSASPAKHATEQSAKTEAARLAAIDKSKKYVVMKVSAIASVEAVSWE